MKRLTRKENHVYTNQSASKLSAQEEKMFRKMTIQFVKGNSFSCSVQLDCGVHGMQLSAGQDVIRKEQNMTLGVCRYVVVGGIHRLHK